MVGVERKRRVRGGGSSKGKTKIYTDGKLYGSKVNGTVYI